MILFIQIKMEEQKNINLTEGEICDLKRALDSLVNTEEDKRDYTHIYTKLNSWYN